MCSIKVNFERNRTRRYFIIRNLKRFLIVIRTLSWFCTGFTVRFTKFLTNGFRSSFEIPEVHCELGNIIT